MDKEIGLETKEPEISEDIKEIEFDEMWHFINSKKQKMDIQSDTERSFI
ncbi:MAG: hypothetical protein LBC04_01010 [Holosporaceae bacterium]|nr:hypothetical protein [Holosporaceae bacterium]